MQRRQLTQAEEIELLEDQYADDRPSRPAPNLERGARNKPKGPDDRTPKTRRARRQELAQRYRDRAGRTQ